MSTADIIILIIVLLLVSLVIFGMIYKRVKKDYCYDCPSKAGCAIKVDKLLKEIDEETKNRD